MESVPLDKIQRFLPEKSGFRIGFSDELLAWRYPGRRPSDDSLTIYERPVPILVEGVILKLGVVARDGDSWSIAMHEPRDDFQNRMAAFRIGKHHLIIGTAKLSTALSNVLLARLWRPMLNSTHPIATYLCSREFESRNDPIIDYLDSLVFLLAENFTLVFEAKSAHAMHPFRRRQLAVLGRKYLAVKDRLEDDLRPPYRVATLGDSDVVISTDLLEEMCKLELTDLWRIDRKNMTDVEITLGS
jgi:hypothetical protein